jgi:hypothetical protein
MEAIEKYGGHISFRDSGDVTFPRRAVLIRSNHATLAVNGMTDADALQKLEIEVAMEDIEQSEPGYL